MNTEKILIQARAKIIWGDSAQSVRDYLIANGLSEEEAEHIIAELNAERHKEIRKAGIKKILIGSVLILVAAIYFLAIFDGGTSRIGRRSAAAPVVCAFGGLYGLWKLIDGIFYLLRPQSETKDISQISD
jgi:hypothetical protein